MSLMHIVGYAIAFLLGAFFGPGLLKAVGMGGGKKG